VNIGSYLEVSSFTPRPVPLQQCWDFMASKYVAQGNVDLENQHLVCIMKKKGA